jgi:anti-sigma regulatory factor (Ser/Thr protein kinase)
MTSTKESWTFPASDAAPALARSAASSLRNRVPADRLDDILLLVSELITNSVRHAGLAGGDLIELHVDVDTGTVRVEVIDPGPGFAADPADPNPDQGSGWGLHLVELLAQRWGVATRGARTVTWFELSL